MPCDYCGRIGGHAAGCPEREPKVWRKCSECGGEIYYGDDCFKVGDDYYCESCCSKTTAEDDPFEDEDRKYEEWREKEWNSTDW